MSLTSSLFTGTSGLQNLGNAMQVIGDNIANVNTVGFKRSGYTFSDVLSQTIGTQSGSAQVGRGMTMGSIHASFDQGSFESTGNTTDLSIGGDGFFMVRQPATQNDFYTRAGNFQFDRDGNLVNSEGYVVQGWELDDDTGEAVGAVTDIALQSFTSPPQASDNMTLITNLDATALSRTEVLTNVWDSTDDNPIIPANFEYQTVVQVYDSLGTTHDITTYFDKKSDSEWEYVITCDPSEDLRSAVQGTAGAGLLARGVISFAENGAIEDMTMSRFTGVVGNLGGALDDSAAVTLSESATVTADGHGFEVEYLGGPAPFWDLTTVPASYAGATIAGTETSFEITFAGDTEPALTFDFPQEPTAGQALTFDINAPQTVGNLHVQDLDNISYTDIDSENVTMAINNPDYLTSDLEGLGLTYATGTWAWDAASLAAIGGTDYAAATIGGTAERVVISLDASGREDIVFEISQAVDVADRINFDFVGTTAWTNVASTNVNGYFEFGADFLGGEGGATAMEIQFDIGSRDDGTGTFVNDTLSTTQYARSSSTTFQSGNGYGAGDLQDVDVSADGIMTGIYSNGQLIPLYRVALAKFNNNEGLFKAGGNLYRETRESGSAVTNPPGENGVGSISPNSLEMSNVDIAEEFVRMITTQRGYQANSKIVTTVDSMLSDVIQMKR